MITSSQLNDFYQQLLSPQSYADYCPNGWQIEGKSELNSIAFAVSATKASIHEAIHKNADALVVHHGLFWHFHGVKTLTGAFAQRVLPLVRQELNLFGYHLPLDGNPEIGNAARLGKLIGCIEQQPFGDYKGSPTGIKGILKEPVNALELSRQLETVLQHPVLLACADKDRLLKSVGIITGGANSEWALAAKQGLDAYITGEMSEHDWHDSQEHGVTMFAGGHNATEQFGIQALMQKTQEEFEVECFFISSENPA